MKERPKVLTAGLAVRRQIRRWLLAQGIIFTEDKGILDSVFYLHCSDGVAKQIGAILTRTFNNPYDH